MLELWFDSPLKNKVFIGSHNLECSAETRKKRYTDEQSGRYDGVHMYSSAGAAAYTDSVANMFVSSLQNSAGDKNNDDFHKRCPQTKFSKKQKRMYSSEVAGSGPIKTQNRFSPLGN